MPPAVAPGTSIGHYRIEAVVGAGSMGDVYRGVDEDLQRKVAIKILSERHRDNRELRARFVREARAVAAISHLNVVQVFTTGQFDGRPYIAMEFLDGIDLGSSVAKDGPWGSLAAAAAIRDAASGLDAAARAGLIHRDVKPTNLVLLQDGTVKVTDFGLAKPLEASDEPALTALGVVVGTPDYIAPEQARGERIDHRVDIYALGGTLYFLLTAMPPFRTGTPAEDKYLKVVARHLRNPVPDARARNPGADAELAGLARSMMAKKAGERPSYAAIIGQLDDIARRLEHGGPGGRIRHPSAQPAPTDGSGGRTAPTPFVAGERRLGTGGDDDGRGGIDAGSAVDAAARRRATTDIPAPMAPQRTEQRAGERPDERAGERAGSVADDAPTRHRIPRSEPIIAQPEPPESGPSVIQPRLPRWLAITTVLAVLTFLVGLGLTLIGPRMLGFMPLTRGSAAPGPASTAVSTLAPAAPAEAPARAARAAPTPPAGMLLVNRPDGAPWFFVDARTVRHGDYAALFPQHVQALEQPSTEPVTGVSFDQAREYAQSKGKRLLTAAEWRAAAGVQGFEPAGALWEWVTDASGRREQHTTIHRRQGVATRGGANAGDVTFRLGMDP
jgi:tRNA A-37 threonylcarbamoyl transferase component Bud32